MSLVSKEQLDRLQRQGDAEKAAAEPIMVPLPEVLRIVRARISANRCSPTDGLLVDLTRDLADLAGQHRKEG